MTDLRVDLYGVRIGTLSGERERFDFAAHQEGRDRFGVGSSVWSIAVPLVRGGARDPRE
jgi:serine/threonine-protein kinase HipA